MEVGIGFLGAEGLSVVQNLVVFSSGLVGWLGLLTLWLGVLGWLVCWLNQGRVCCGCAKYDFALAQKQPHVVYGARAAVPRE